MLKNSKKFLAIAIAALFFSTPLASTASAAAPDLSSPMQLELRSNHHSSPSHGRAPSHSIGHNKGHKAPSHKVHHAPKPRPSYHSSRRHVGHRPPPPPRHSRHHHHHSSDGKVIGGLIAGVILGTVIANNT